MMEPMMGKTRRDVDLDEPRAIAGNLANTLGIPSKLASPGGRHAAEALAALKQARDAGGGALRFSHLARAQSHISALNPRQHPALVQHLQAHVLALQGRGSDTKIAHMTPGEVVIPKRMQTPELMKALREAAHAAGHDPDALRIGNRRNPINPRTGLPEFDDGDDDTDGLETGAPTWDDLLGNDARPQYDDEVADDEPDDNSQRYEVAANTAVANDASPAPKPYSDPATGISCPVATPQVKINSPFGPRKGGFHDGADIANPKGGPVFSTEDGTVISTSPTEKGGNQIIVRNASGSVSGYAHTQSVSGLKVGQQVTTGQRIGTTDLSGDSQGPHLHYTYRPAAGAARIDPIANHIGKVCRAP